MTTETHTGSTLFRVLTDPGDKFAWERFVYRHQGRIRKWCRQWGAQEADADDVCQMIMCKLLEQLQNFRYESSKGKFRSWLKTVTRNTWLNLRKQPCPISLDDAACADCAEMLQDIWEREMFDEAVARVLPQIDEQTWRAFELYVLENRTPEEVSRLTGKSIPAIYMAKYRVTKRLRDEIALLAGN